MIKKYLGISFALVAISLGIFLTINKVISQNEKITSMNVHTSLAQYDLGDLTTKSEVIVKGRVVSKSDSRWNNNSNKKPDNILSKDMIFQDNTFKISNVIKGKLRTKDTVIIRTYGGKTPDFEITNDSEPNFILDEDVTVFLTYDDSICNTENSKEYMVVLGASQGLFKNINGKRKNITKEISRLDFESEINKFIKYPKSYPQTKSIEN